ncbi:hypothetical protein C6V83_05700 [Gordonia iterans]|uniref:Uncharacterized protein n=1 Tax=Gordonia iterans TaxID=1004901 RepID=A0A2S0KDT5_9ACTN|nr:hypothetical protein [Gordonia iterans]AVL99846.1 hypothetical protein C6V83_05700 [Gordonia iterans]
MIARVNGLSAGLVSAILGIAAHGFAGGFHPDTRQFLILAVTAVAVGAARAAQVDRDRRRRRRGRLESGTLSLGAVLVTGQAAAHGALTLLGPHAGHHDVNGAAMLGWHAAALPAAVVALAALQWLLGLLSSARATVPGYRPARRSPSYVRAYRSGAVLHALQPVLSVGTRAPPLAA